MSVSAQDVNKLRQQTGAGMMDCKKALTEASGDFQAAIDILRKKGQKVSAARADRETTEGGVFIKETATGAFLVALGCETDFVAKNDEFLTLGNALVDAAAAANSTDVSTLVIGGKPASEVITDLIGKIGEKVDVIAIKEITAEKVATYVHGNGKIGVIVGFKNVGSVDITAVGKDVAMQIAAMRPIAVDKDGVDATTVEREIEVGKDQARNEGKPEEMLEKIAQGRLNKFYKENTLLNQEFVKDNSKTITQLLDGVNKGLTVTSFNRVEIG